VPAIKVGTGSGAAPLMTTLAPAQVITGRVTYADTGKPVTRAAKNGPLAGEAGNLDLIDPVNYASGIMSGRDGRITYPALIPGAPYRFARLSKEFTVKPGEILELGDVPIQLPRR
jgi:hypothetical protein